MTDPFEALREPVSPAEPDPGFAGRLRQRLAREVFAFPGGTMSQQTAEQAAQAQAQAEREPARAPALTPYIIVSDARRAMDWYIEVLGARRRGEPVVNADGTIGHAELGISDAVLMLAEPSGLWPDVPVRAPDHPARSATPCTWRSTTSTGPPSGRGWAGPRWSVSRPTSSTAAGR